MALSVIALSDFSLDEKTKRMAILLNCKEDRNVQRVIRKTLQIVPLAIIADLYKQAVTSVLDGWFHSFHVALISVALCRNGDKARQLWAAQDHHRYLPALASHLLADDYSTGAGYWNAMSAIEAQLKVY